MIRPAWDRLFYRHPRIGRDHRPHRQHFQRRERDRVVQLHDHRLQGRWVFPLPPTQFPRRNSPPSPSTSFPRFPAFPRRTSWWSKESRFCHFSPPSVYISISSLSSELPDPLDNLSALLDYLAAALRQNNAYLVSILVYVLSIADLPDPALHRIITAGTLSHLHTYLQHHLAGTDPLRLSGSNLINVLYYTLGFIDRYLDKPRTLFPAISLRTRRRARQHRPGPVGPLAALRRRSHACVDPNRPSGPRLP